MALPRTPAVAKLPSDLAEAFSQTQVELIKSVIAKDATDDELKLFLYTAKRTGLDPLTRQIYFQKRKSKQKDGSFREQMVILTGIDGYRAIATRSKELAGEDDVVFDREDTPNPNKATVTVYRLVGGQRCGFTATARWSEYAALDYNGQPQQMWKKMPYLMLGKCASALAYRKAFPNDLSGIYTTEEMQQADNPSPEAPVSPKSAPQSTVVAKEVPAVEMVDEEPGQALPTVRVDDDIPVVEGYAGALPLAEDECPSCHGPISVAEVGYSQRIYKTVLCRNCQAEYKRSGLAE